MNIPTELIEIIISYLSNPESIDSLSFTGSNLNWGIIHQLHFDIYKKTNLTEYLKFLRMGRLSKNLSPDCTYENLDEMTKLWLTGCKLNNLSDLNCLINLRILDLSRNDYTLIPPLNLINLTILVLDDNKISDLKFLTDLTNLMELYLSKNMIQDITPLKNLTNLLRLDLSYNQITGLSDTFDYLTKLYILKLNDNLIRMVPYNLYRMTTLIKLELNNNRIKRLPDEWVNLPDLMELDFSDNPIEEIPRGMTNLVDLSISNGLFLTNCPIKNDNGIFEYFNLFNQLIKN